MCVALQSAGNPDGREPLHGGGGRVVRGLHIRGAAGQADPLPGAESSPAGEHAFVVTPDGADHGSGAIICIAPAKLLPENTFMKNSPTYRQHKENFL